MTDPEKKKVWEALTAPPPKAPLTHAEMIKLFTTDLKARCADPEQFKILKLPTLKWPPFDTKQQVWDALTKPHYRSFEDKLSAIIEEEIKKEIDADILNKLKTHHANRRVRGGTQDS